MLIINRLHCCNIENTGIVLVGNNLVVVLIIKYIEQILLSFMLLEMFLKNLDLHLY